MIPENVLIGIMDDAHKSDEWREAVAWMQIEANWFAAAESTEVALIAMRLLRQTPPKLRTEAGWYYWTYQAGYPDSQEFWHGPVAENPEYKIQFHVSQATAERYETALVRLRRIVYMSGAVDRVGTYRIESGFGHEIAFNNRPYFDSFAEAESAK